MDIIFGRRKIIYDDVFINVKYSIWCGHLIKCHIAYSSYRQRRSFKWRKILKSFRCLVLNLASNYCAIRDISRIGTITYHWNKSPTQMRKSYRVPVLAHVGCSISSSNIMYIYIHHFLLCTSSINLLLYIYIISYIQHIIHHCNT